jgi:hypothetical protein
MTITTTMTLSFKKELFSGGHCIKSTVTPTGSASSGSTLINTISSMTGIVLGMSVSGTNIDTDSYVSKIVSSSSMLISKPTLGIISGGTLTITGDILKMALIKASPSGNYGASSVNYSDIVGNSDETSGTGYTASGNILGNVSATGSGTTAYITFSPNPSWTSATFSTTGCMIYNSSSREAGLSGTNGLGGGRSISTHDFGSTQTVTAGTFTVLIPSATVSTAILRIQ